MLNLEPPKTIQTQTQTKNGTKLASIVTPTPSMVNDYRFLRLEWTDEDEKIEFIMRYNITRNGFWITSAPDRGKFQLNLMNSHSIQTSVLKFELCFCFISTEDAHYRDQHNYGRVTGLVQVIVASESYLVLTFCETIPTQKLFSIILARRTSLLPIDVCFFCISIPSLEFPTVK